MSADTTTSKQDSHTEQNLKNIHESGTNALCTDDLNEPFECDILGNSILSNQYHTEHVTDEVQINAASVKNPDNFFIFTNEMRVESNLLKLVTDMNIPIYVFKKLWNGLKMHTN